ESVDAMADLKLSAEEKNFLAGTCPYLDPTYLDFLQGYRYNPEEVVIRQENNELKIEIAGLWYRTILWEVPVMALVSELFYLLSRLNRETDKEITRKAREKMHKYEALEVNIAEFGTRRRHSYA